MTAPVVTPSKWKTWIGLVGSLLAFAVPMLISVQDTLPEPWPAVIGAVLAVATATGIYHAPFAPKGTVLAPDTPEVAAAAAQAPPRVPGTYKNPWGKT